MRYSHPRVTTDTLTATPATGAYTHTTYLVIQYEYGHIGKRVYFRRGTITQIV